MGGTYAGCYDILYDAYHQTVQETNKIINKYEDVIQEIVDSYEYILADWTKKRLSEWAQWSNKGPSFSGTKPEIKLEPGHSLENYDTAKIK